MFSTGSQGFQQLHEREVTVQAATNSKHLQQIKNISNKKTCFGNNDLRLTRAVSADGEPFRLTEQGRKALHGGLGRDYRSGQLFLRRFIGRNFDRVLRIRLGIGGVPSFGC